MHTLLLNALDKAYESEIDQTYQDEGKAHRARSVAWIDALGNTFRDSYADDDTIRVFWKQNPDNKREFKLNELLHDVVVARCQFTASPKHKVQIPYVEETLWQIESELAPNAREAILDFNKLVLGSARNKLFVGPLTKDEASFRSSLLAPARKCVGNVYAAFIPQPKHWYERNPEVHLWKYNNLNWEPVDDFSL